MVSILQRLGLSKAKPVHSRAKEAPKVDAKAAPARRQEVKAKTTKATPAKPVAKAKPAAKAAAKPVAKGKVASKAAPKVVAKAAKPAAKPVAKPAAKPVAKAAVKAKVAAKPVAKPVAKKAAKPAPKPVAKTPAKSAAKPVAKPAAKPAPKATPKVVVKAPVKAASKPAVKAPAKPTPKVAPAKPTIPTGAKASPPQGAVAAPAKEPKPMSVPTAASPAAPAAPAAKPGRPSSRLAQLTVPSMAQSVASTAAKASYGPSTQNPIIAPVIPVAMKKDAKLANNWKTKTAAELSDAELLSMPDSEYMNEVQMAAFRLKLLALKNDILSNAGETTEHLREDSAVTPDPADRATIEEEHALELRTRDRERKLLKKIEQSINRIDAGDYGYCDETGEAIGVGRLLARPTATLSLEAQQRRELKQKMFGD